MDKDPSLCFLCLTNSAKEQSGDRLCIDCRIKAMGLPKSEKQHTTKNAGLEISSNEPDQKRRISLLLAKSRSIKLSLELEKAFKRSVDAANERKPFCENCKVRLKSWARTGKDGWIVTSKYCQAPACAKLESHPSTNSKTTDNDIEPVADDEPAANDATKSQQTETLRKRRVPQESKTYRSSRKVQEKQAVPLLKLQQPGRQPHGPAIRQHLAAESADTALLRGAAAPSYGSISPKNQKKNGGTYEKGASEAPLEPEEGAVLAGNPPGCSSIPSGRTETLGDVHPVIKEDQSVAVASEMLVSAQQTMVCTQPWVNPVHLGGGLDVPQEETCYSAPLTGHAPSSFMASNLHDPVRPTAATQFWDSPCSYSPPLSNTHLNYHPAYPFYPAQQLGATFHSRGPPQPWSTPPQIHSNIPLYTLSHGFYGTSPGVYQPLTSPQAEPGFAYQPEVQPPSPTSEPVFPSLNDPQPPPPPQPQYGYDYSPLTAYQSTHFVQNSAPAWGAPTPNIY